MGLGGTRSIFTTRSRGLGDLKLAAMVGLFDWDRQAVHVNLGVSVPTGSVGESDALPTSSGSEVQLPYPMQTGSGTWDLLPGLDVLGPSRRILLGRTGDGNDHRSRYVICNR